MGYNSKPESEAVQKEIEIRGRFITMSCDLEFSLLNIIMYTSADPYDQKRMGDFTTMHLNEKIQNATCDLKDYNMSYYVEFKDYFDVLDEFRQVRNHMAHALGFFTDEIALDVFRVSYIDKENKKDKSNKTEWFAYKEYTEVYIVDSLNRFLNAIQHIAMLHFRLKQEFDQRIKNNPFVRPSTDNV